MLKGVIFDLDGVLIDSHPIHIRCWKIFLASVGKDVTDADLQFVVDGRKKEDILRHFLGDLSDSEIAEYGRRKEAIFREEAADISTGPGMREFVADLHAHGVLMAVASSGSNNRVHYILDHLKLSPYFSAIVTADDVAHAKPDPGIFLTAAERLHCAPTDVAVIEDAVSGVMAAKAAGMLCIAIASDGRAAALAEAGADRVITEFSEITLSLVQRALAQKWVQAGRYNSGVSAAGL